MARPAPELGIPYRPSVCTPGSTGIAQVTAVAHGVPSAPVTVYVHQHVTSVVINKVPNQPPTLSNICLSKRAPSGNPESWLYQAFAFNGNTDITSSVGPLHGKARHRQAKLRLQLQ